ncbi:aldehyde dehydrogenase domain-containing protein [Cyathus striatus]|nr:aldehyde dehydrogenase domain-containing protein [Cyathus striatus]
MNSRRVILVQRRFLHRDAYWTSPSLGPYHIQAGHEEFIVSNPATGEKLCTVTAASAEDVKFSIDKAQKTFESGVWSKSSAIARSKVLSKLARALEERIPELAQIETLQTGRTIREMKAQLGRLPEWLDYYSALLRTNQSYVAPTQGKLLNYIQRIPLGVVAQITPFNHPLLIAVKKIAPALAAGNSVIVKPSEHAPITVLEFAEMAAEVGVPEGALTVLPGFGAVTGKEIVRNPLIRKVDVTAGTQTGRMLGSVVGANLASYTAELGGKAPIIVFNDADLVSAVNGTAFAAFVASGQTCVSGTRIIIQEGVYDRFMELFLEKVSSIKRRMGNPSNINSTMGAVISEQHLQRIVSMISHTKGKVLVGGERMSGLSELDGFDFSKGSFFPPTIDELWQEEVFGPVVVVKRFTEESEGVALANACKYGLGAGIWTSDLSRAHRVAADIEAGLCWVNTHHRNDPSSPWGGMKESGIGRENGLEAFAAYSQSKSTIINIATAEESREADDWFAEIAEGRRYG